MSTIDANRRSILLSAAALSSLVTLLARSGVETARPAIAVRHSERQNDVEQNNFGDIGVEVRDDVALMGLRGMTSAVFEKLPLVYAWINRNSAIRAVVIYSFADNFCSSFQPGASLSPTNCKLEKPSVVVVHGEARGAAYSLLLSSDVRIACADARFGNLDAIASDSQITTTLIADIGRANANRYLLSGDTFGAHEAFRMGLIQDILPTRQEALDAGIVLARRIGRNASARSS
jgi:enoyl-CoA hydratase/carnithine racemase